jgi:predicted nuclease of predicted toxin-antitoxin system
VKFLVDMPLSPTLAQWLQSQGHDAVHASVLGLDRAPDTDIIERAKNELRIVITADLDYPRLLALAGATGPSLI